MLAVHFFFFCSLQKTVGKKHCFEEYKITGASLGLTLIVSLDTTVGGNRCY